MILKRLPQFTMHLLLISLVFIFIGCSNESPEEAIHNGWSGEIEVNDIISKQETNHGTFVFFSAYDVDGNDKFERVGVALMDKNSDSDWELNDSTIDTVASDSFAAHHKILHIENEKGKVIEIPIAFGKVGDINISSVTAEVNNEIEKIEIIPINSGRYFYKVNAWGPIKALDKNGKVIDQYGF
ncbi:hypothetical protein [Pontibacillus marinus]|uniref:Uncharacterized protein n=1 Tax=Pontibacillus marinus BH030004 = DSM 16465 TaxID=1385511 RepID=A0A0A5GDQ6_9BACI|nr:hypothetical protein [Pontibacillus marinus]KGX90114.1 hypothetical protein N783_01090 [Pontibacillus marinus BH030004 = DSM 16465]